MPIVRTSDPCLVGRYCRCPATCPLHPNGPVAVLRVPPRSRRHLLNAAGRATWLAWVDQANLPPVTARLACLLIEMRAANVEQDFRQFTLAARLEMSPATVAAGMRRLRGLGFLERIARAAPPPAVTGEGRP
jgi:hypothetical protein